jgi:hypothetical protein
LNATAKAASGWALSSMKGHGTGREGLRWSAVLLRDGRKVATVDEDGGGGPLRIDWLGAPAQRVENAAALEASAAALPPLVLGSGRPLPQNADTMLGGMADDAADAAKVRRLLKAKTLFQLKSDAPGTYWTLSQRYTPQVGAALRAQHGENLVRILNEEPEQAEAAVLAAKGGVT